MALFNIPKRKEVSITDIVKQAQEERTEKPKIKLKSGTLLGKLEAIKETVKKNLGDVANDYLLITTDGDFIDYCKKASMCEYVALDTETMGLEFDEQCSIVGISLMAKGMQAMYAPIGHLSTLTEELAPKQISKSALKRGIELLYESNVDIIFHNAYYDLVVIYANTNIWLRIAWDTMPCAFLLNENESHSLKYLYDKYVMNGDAGVHKFAELFDGINFCYVPYNYAYIYAAHDAEMTLKLYEFQKPFMTKGTDECKEYKLEKISDIFFNEELPLIPILAEMKYRGIEIDMDRAKELHDKYTRLWEDAKQKYYDAVSYYKDDILAYNKIHSDKPIEYPVNYDSPLQLQILFYDIIKTGVIFKKEPRGTGKHVLEEVLANPKYRNTPFYKIVETLSNVKKYYKVLSTFVDELPKTAKRLGGRLHSNFNSCSAHTGRMSSNNCNYQQLPSKLGDIRNMFVAGKNRVMISCDISKEEVCVAAAISKDEKLLDALSSGLDVYSKIASIAFNNKYEDNLEFYPDGTTNKEGKARRSASKAVTLGCLYSKGVQSISEDLKISKERAQEVYDAVMKAFPTLAQWIKDTEAFGLKYHYVDGLYGRRRRLTDLALQKYEIRFNDYVGNKLDNASKNYYRSIYIKRMNNASFDEKQNVVNEASEHGIIIVDNSSKINKSLRRCVNSIVQGSSADICKRVLVMIGNDPIMKKLDAKLELSIHDEQIVSCPKENAYDVAKRLEYLTINAGGKELGIKLKVDTAISDCWYGDEYDFDDNHQLVNRR